MSIKAKISDIVSSMQIQSDDMPAYLEKATGQCVAVSEEYLRIADGEEEDPFSEDRADWEKEEIELAQRITNTEDFIALPDKFEINEYRIMEDFTDSIENPGKREQLQLAIKGKGAFRRFKDKVGRLGLLANWYSFRDERYATIARDWCEANEIEILPE